MCTDIVLRQSSTELIIGKFSTDRWTVNNTFFAKPDNDLPEILTITSFPPRECGIATYSKDLINALNNQFNNTFSCVICALESDTEKHMYKQTPKYILNTDERNAFAKTAFHINHDDKIQLVVIQHEFGFYASKEKEFKQFFETLLKPLVFVFHTVLPKPHEELRKKVKDMANAAASIIVMTKDAANILKNEYAVDEHKITVIPHGTHLVPPLERKKLKNRYHLTDRKVLSTFGLLSSSKSIETTLDALPAIAKDHPDVLFLILGKTHPSVVKHEGEQYRQMLEKKVTALKMEKHVRFVNEYLQLPILLEYLQLSDIYLFTSKDPNQAVSGTFSYAVSCGCPVISTPMPHAKEVLSNNNGIIFDFGNTEQLTQAVISLLNNEKLRAEISSNSFHKMASTAWQNSAIAHALLFNRLISNTDTLHYRIPAINLNHVKKMTTGFGMIQFAKIANPDIHSGYTLDDNARALIAVCQHYELFQNDSDLVLINTYLQYIKHCMQPNGVFVNYVNEQFQFTEQNNLENLEDSNGRAIWALGYLMSLKDILPIKFSIDAEDLLMSILPHFEKIHSTRAMAFAIKGLYYMNEPEHFHLLQTLANRLVQMYRHEKADNWHWFENYLTYGNSLLPEAMLCAYLSTNNETYKNIANESLEFLVSQIFVDEKIKVISNKGWHIKDVTNQKQIGGEQPIDVAYTIIALEKFYAVFGNQELKTRAITAFNWFLGDNHLQQIMYNPCTGGCYDGLEEFNVNLNQGAESTLSYLMARLAIEKLVREDAEPELAILETIKYEQELITVIG